MAPPAIPKLDINSTATLSTSFTSGASVAPLPPLPSRSPSWLPWAIGGGVLGVLALLFWAFRRWRG